MTLDDLELLLVWIFGEFHRFLRLRGNNS